MNTHDRVLGVEEIQKKVLFALENLLDYWAIHELKTQDTHYVSNNIQENRNGDMKKPVMSRMTVHDLTVDAAEVASTMFLHPSLRVKKSKCILK